MSHPAGLVSLGIVVEGGQAEMGMKEPQATLSCFQTVRKAHRDHTGMTERGSRGKKCKYLVVGC